MIIFKIPSGGRSNMASWTTGMTLEGIFHIHPNISLNDPSKDYLYIYIEIQSVLGPSFCSAL